MILQQRRVKSDDFTCVRANVPSLPFSASDSRSHSFCPMQNNQPASVGSTGADAFFWIPPLPTIVAEWAALIPLIVHLASAQDDHRMIGEAALRGTLSTGMFPKLGHLNGIARLLHNGPDFLDCASSKGGLISRAAR
jgi:hypothetical protein